MLIKLCNKIIFFDWLLAAALIQIYCYFRQSYWIISGKLATIVVLNDNIALI